MFKVHVPLYWPNVHDDVEEEEFVTVKTLKRTEFAVTKNTV